MRKAITVFSLLSAIFFLSILTPLSAVAQAVFVENKGQWPDQVSHQVRINGGAMFMQEDGFRFILYHEDDWNRHHQHQEQGDRHTDEKEASDSVRGHVWDVRFLNTTTYGYQEGQKKLDGKQNYLIGNDRSKWGRNASRYGEVMWHGMYKGIDMEVGSSEDGHLKWNFHVAPRANPGDIQFVYDHAETWLRDGKLFIETSVGEFYEYIPLAYQEIKGKRVPLPCTYTKQEGQYGFIFPDGYNPKYPLVIDPVLDFASYSGSEGDNFGFTATYDHEGHLYGAGIVLYPAYPVLAGAFQKSFSDPTTQDQDGLVDVGITKFTKDGSSLVYSTYLGAPGAETPNSLVVNERCELYILGLTSSQNFPTSPNAYQPINKGGDDADFRDNGPFFRGGTDIYIACLDSSGSNLIGGTFLGGTKNDGLNNGAGGSINTDLAYNYGDIFRGEIVLDANSNVYIASCTQSTDFPVTPNAPGPAPRGAQDGIVASLTADLSTLRWSTYLGGIDHDAAYSLKLNPNGDVIVTGGTESFDFPLAGISQNPTHQGGADGFIAIISSGGTNLLASTFAGTSSLDQCYLVDTDVSGNIYVTGISEGQIQPTPNVYSIPNSGQFIAQYSSDLSTQNWITTFGEGDGDPELAPTAFLVDSCNNIYFSGWGGETNVDSRCPDSFLDNLPLTPDAFQDSTDGSDFYFFVLSPDADSLLFATYFGGLISAEHVDGGTSRFDKAGIIYQAVCAGCQDDATGMSHSDFPTTPGAWSNQNQSPNCNMAVAKIEFQFAQIIAEAYAMDTVGCVPLTVNFVNNSTPGISYHWDFGDGTTSDKIATSHTYTKSGTYQVELVVRDSSSYCQTEDRTFLPKIHVHDSAVAAFTYTPQPARVNEPIGFTNASTGTDEFQWSFGDGNVSTQEHATHSYQEPGEYKVCLLIGGNSNCNDSICTTITIPIIGLPNAFSPNGEGNNDVLNVRGVGIQEVLLKIYNRWGELVFETNDQALGWDGTYKGVPQEQEVYVYYLDAVLETGEVVQEKGNITLIR